MHKHVHVLVAVTVTRPADGGQSFFVNFDQLINVGPVKGPFFSYKSIANLLDRPSIKYSAAADYQWNLPGYCAFAPDRTLFFWEMLRKIK